MNATDEMTRRLDVAEFVESVRAELADLSVDDREDLVDGLEADLTERLLETDPTADPAVVFGSAAAYAAELRGAAGFPAVSTRGRRSWGSRLSGARERLIAAGERPVVRAFLDLAIAMRPAWWVIRAWLALQVADLFLGRDPHDWMLYVNGFFFGGLLLLAAIVVSVQIGRGAWWPSSERSSWPRRVLIALNVFAVVTIAPVLSAMPTNAATSFDRGWAINPGSHGDGGLRMNGQRVHNVYAYDAEGNPILGVQLFDEPGHPLSVSDYVSRHGRNWTYDVAYPWAWTMSQADDSTNVFPLPVKRQPDKTIEDGALSGPDAARPDLPFETVPALTVEAREQIAKALQALDLGPPADHDKPDKKERDGRATIGR